MTKLFFASLLMILTNVSYASTVFYNCRVSRSTSREFMEIRGTGISIFRNGMGVGSLSYLRPKEDFYQLDRWEEELQGQALLEAEYVASGPQESFYATLRLTENGHETVKDLSCTKIYMRTGGRP